MYVQDRASKIKTLTLEAWVLIKADPLSLSSFMDNDATGAEHGLAPQSELEPFIEVVAKAVFELISANCNNRWLELLTTEQLGTGNICPFSGNSDFINIVMDKLLNQATSVARKMSSFCCCGLTNVRASVALQQNNIAAMWREIWTSKTGTCFKNTFTHAINCCPVVHFLQNTLFKLIFQCLIKFCTIF